MSRPLFFSRPPQSDQQPRCLGAGLTRLELPLHVCTDQIRRSDVGPITLWISRPSSHFSANETQHQRLSLTLWYSMTRSSVHESSGHSLRRNCNTPLQCWAQKEDFTSGCRISSIHNPWDTSEHCGNTASITCTLQASLPPKTVCGVPAPIFVHHGAVRAAKIFPYLQLPHLESYQSYLVFLSLLSISRSTLLSTY